MSVDHNIGGSEGETGGLWKPLRKFADPKVLKKAEEIQQRNNDLINELNQSRSNNEKIKHTSQQELLNLEKRYKEEISSIIKKYESEINSIKSAYDSELLSLKNNHTTEISKINETNKKITDTLKEKLIPSFMRNNEYLRTSYNMLIDRIEDEHEIYPIIANLINLSEPALWNSEQPKSKFLPNRIHKLSESLYVWHNKYKSTLPSDYMDKWLISLNELISTRDFNLKQVFEGEPYLDDLHDSGGEPGLTLRKIESFAVIFSNSSPIKAMVEVNS